MSKGQIRSSKEPRKPKQDKAQKAKLPPTNNGRQVEVLPGSGKKK
ncbi:hypothetical protein P7F60_03730 [Rhizobium sp. YJ-22]|nr:hypothetical protein [Rhizobium sp. YJ-22]MDG3575485.1 hypothetical protein [Rhizobium sp. YJ-22]